MDLDRPEEALNAYKASDEIWPDRFNTLLGAAKAAEESGQDETARIYYERLLGNAGNSDRLNVEEISGFVSQ